MRQLPPADAESQLIPAETQHRATSRPGYVDYYGEAQGDNDAPSGGILEYWHIIQTRKCTVAVITSLGVLASIIFTLPQTPIYQARTVIEIQGLNEDFMHMREVNPTAVQAATSPEYELQTQVKVLQSNALLERVIKKLESQKKLPATSEPRMSAWRKALQLGEQKSHLTREQAVALAARSLRVRSQANTRLIDIIFESPDPKFAADFSNTLGYEFIEHNLDARWETTQHTGEWLSHQMEEVKRKLEKSEEALQNYARQTNLIFTQEKDNVADQRLKQLQDELSKAQADRVSRQARYELAARASEESIGEVIDDASLKDIQAKLTDLRRQAAELSSIYTPTHPRVLKVQAQITALDGSLRADRANIIRRIQNDFESARWRERLLSAEYAAQTRLITSQADDVAHYNILKREVDTNRQIYDSMLQRVKEAGIASALRASNIRVVDPALIPKSPYKPNLFTNATLGLFGGGLLGIVFVVFQARANRTIQEPGDLSRHLGIPELGTVPTSRADPFRVRRLVPSRSGATSSQTLALITMQRKPSVIAEAVRATVTSILFSHNNGKPPQVIVISSAAPKEGKTTLCTNLAIALAEVHDRVLLIDADMRKPRAHTIFNCDNREGLVDLLRRSDPITSLNGEIHPTALSNLSVLTSGTAKDGDTTLLHSQRLRELIHAARKQYKTIIIDTPPMLSVADARIIAKHADAVILIARAQQTLRAGLREAYERFLSDGTTVLGAIINDWNPHYSSRYGYHKYYDSYQHYYRDTVSKNTHN